MSEPQECFTKVRGGWMERWFYDDFLANYEFEEEARWVLFLHLLGYKKSGDYCFDGGIVLIKNGLKLIIVIEAEGKNNIEADSNMRKFISDGCQGFVDMPKIYEVKGLPLYRDDGEDMLDIWDYEITLVSKYCEDEGYYLCKCDSCEEIGIEFNGRSGRVAHAEGCRNTNSDKNYNTDAYAILAVSDVAMGDYFVSNADMAKRQAIKDDV